MKNHTLVIAEAGVNHNGDLSIAKQLIEAAAAAGADYVKFQTFVAEKLVSATAEKAAYQKATTGTEESQYQMLKKLELDLDAHQTLMDHAQKCNIRFLSTAFDLDSIELLMKLDMDLFKIPSGEITNLPYLEMIGRSGKHIIMSTGMADMKEIGDALEVLERAGTPRNKVTVLHCNTQYPTPMEDVNLLAMQSIADAFDVPVGYSDHTLGIEVPIAAVALGAKVIEKHFTLDTNMPGPDHKASLEPDEMKAMVTGIRNIEQALGNGIKMPSESEKKNINIARKSIHINRKLNKGHKIEKSDLIMLRPGDGISPFKIYEIIGRELKNDLPDSHMLSYDDLK